MRLLRLTIYNSYYTGITQLIPTRYSIMSIEVTIVCEKRWSSRGHIVDACLADSSVWIVVTHGDQKKLSGLGQPVGMGGRAEHNASSS